jgi:Spy/CpxP family protein refolding chaperone
MICLAIGAGILAAVAFHKARRCRYGYWHGYHHGYGWHHHGHGRWPLYAALSRIDATPAQERAIVNEVEQLKSRLHNAKSTMKDARGDLAAAVRGPTLDDAALGAVLGRVDGATGEARGAVVDALRNIHALLDDKQRAQLADLLDHGWWRRGGSPYRV